jgi:two-component system response regulator MprA
MERGHQIASTGADVGETSSVASGAGGRVAGHVAGPSLLLVEDDARLSRLLARLLSGDGFVVTVATDGHEAVGIFDASPPFDVIVLDVGLPGIDGLEVARHIRSTGSTGPIIMLTARDGMSDRSAGLHAGADDYLVKPFAYDELIARIRANVRQDSGTKEHGDARSPS